MLPNTVSIPHYEMEVSYGLDLPILGPLLALQGLTYISLM